MTNEKKPGNLSALLWTLAGVLLVGMLIARAVFPELVWLTVVIALPLVATLGALIQQNQKALKSRTAAYGLNSIVTIVLVIGIVGVLNFLAAHHEKSWDLTKNKVHTLSDQTEKLVKGLTKPVKAALFAKLPQREQFRPLLERYHALNPTQFEIEYVDPDKEPTRAKQVGIKKYGTLELVVGARDDKLEDPNEEKLTNALIKLLKDKSPVLCSVKGHGEKSFGSLEAEGYDTAKKALVNQAYEVRDLEIAQEGNKVPDSCDAIAILGPTKAFFAPELQAIKTYLENGGHAIIAVDLNLKGGEYAPELLSLLEEWHVKPGMALVIDPLSRMLGVDASVSLLASYAKDNPITKDFQGNCYFPFSRPLEIVPGAPASLKVSWLGQTTPKSWEVTDMKALASGQVSVEPGRDKNGPFNEAVTVDGKLAGSKAPRNTRMVVFGTSYFATNNYSRFGGNLDFFLNSVSWVMQDESMISIRAKEEGPGKVELSQKQGTFIFLLTVILIPLLVAVAGIVIWVFRRRL